MKKIQLAGLAQKLRRVALVSAVALAATAGTSAYAQIVQNGFFQDNDSSFSSYAGGANGYYGTQPIPDFTETVNGEGAGLNGYDIIYNGNPQKQFAPTGYSPSATTDPRDFAYVQNSGDSLTQNLTGLDAFTRYHVSFLVAQRYSDTANVGTVSVSGGVRPTQSTDSVTGQSAFTMGGFNFETGGSATGLVLTLANTTPLTVPITYPEQPSQDRDVDFADIVITRIGVPEPGAYALLGLGALALVFALRRPIVNS